MKLGSLKNTDIELVLEAINEGYSKNQLAAKYGITIGTFNKFIKGKIPECEFCNGAGEISRDNSDGMAVEYECHYCKGTGFHDSLVN